MNQGLKYFKLLVWLSAVLLLSSCERVDETNLVNQKNLFLQSILQVEEAGRMLQSNPLTQQQIDKALEQMDQGLAKAFEVEKTFLQRLDQRLPGLYTETFIPGVQQYRLGVESSDRQQQVQGLNLLLSWSQYWQQQRGVIKDRLTEMDG